MEQLSNLIIKRKKKQPKPRSYVTRNSPFFFKGKRTKRKDGWGVGNFKNKQKKKNECNSKRQSKKKKEKTRN